MVPLASLQREVVHTARAVGQRRDASVRNIQAENMGLTFHPGADVDRLALLGPSHFSDGLIEILADGFGWFAAFRGRDIDVRR